MAAAGEQLARLVQQLAKRRHLAAWRQLAQRLAWYRQQVLLADAGRRGRVLAAWRQAVARGAWQRQQLQAARLAAARRALRAWRAAAGAQRGLKLRLAPLLLRQDLQLAAGALAHWRALRLVAVAGQLAWHLAGCFSRASVLSRALCWWRELGARRSLVRSRMLGSPRTGGALAHHEWPLS
jgi:hypothetical protein